MARVDQDRTDILTGSFDPKTPLVRDPGLPAAQGLYDPSLEKDSCGVGFVAHIGIKITVTFHEYIYNACYI